MSETAYNGAPQEGVATNIREEETAPAEHTAPNGAEGTAGDSQVVDESGEQPGEVASLEAELAAARSQADEYLDQWRRAAAEFQNYRRRQERERQELSRTANAQLMTRLLPVLDDLKRAAQHVPEALREDEWVSGVLMIERKLWSVLEQAGVQPIEAGPGTAFDPNLHDALLAEPSETIAEGDIVAELEPGYMLGDRVLRPAKVKVAR